MKVMPVQRITKTSSWYKSHHHRIHYSEPHN